MWLNILTIIVGILAVIIIFYARHKFHKLSEETIDILHDEIYKEGKQYYHDIYWLLNAAIKAEALNESDYKHVFKHENVEDAFYDLIEKILKTHNILLVYHNNEVRFKLIPKNEGTNL